MPFTGSNHIIFGLFIHQARLHAGWHWIKLATVLFAMYLAGALYYWDHEWDSDYDGKDMEAMATMLCTAIIVNVVMWFLLVKPAQKFLLAVAVFLFVAFFATSLALAIEMHDYDDDTVLNWFIAFIIAVVILFILFDPITMGLI